ncbi:mavicyanin-like [Arachis ipaensis]|uniref:mavicyanin-like n=1 Tax=Arachis ipaensis TaxID=130454 RepID=UPI000A2B3EA4|nr:mavicyanin-like [Arachis ipaensis]
MSHLFKCVILFIMLCTTASREFKVGDHFGWRVPDPTDTSFYTHWAERNRFQVGDSLVFEYENDSVLSVEEWDYFHCDASNPITAFDNGKSILNLDSPGAFYFISGTAHHCSRGPHYLCCLATDRCNENELGSFTFAEVLAGLGLRQCRLGHLLGALRKQVALFGL